MNNPILFGVVLAGLLFCAPAVSTSLTTGRGVNRISTGKDSSRVEVVLGVSETTGNRCLLGKKKCFSVNRLEIFFAKNKVFVPDSAYSDIYDASRASLIMSGDKGMVEIEGGDASEGYVVKIWFDRNRVLRRALYGELSDSLPLEETKYNDVSF